MTQFDIRCEVEARLNAAREQMREAEIAGVNSPGFNQWLGSYDALGELLEWLDDNE